jgi:hypothetical protein
VSGPGATNLSEILGWDLPSTSSGAVPAATATHTLSGTSTQQFLTLFLPLAAGATNPVALVSNTGPTSAEVWLNDGRRLRVSADPNPARGLKFVEILANGLTNRNVGAGFGPPVFTGITNRAMNPNTVKMIPFSVVDTDGSGSNVVLTAASLNPAVVPDASLALSGSGSNRVLTITPPANVTGTARLVLNATDPAGSTIASDFVLSVNSPPQTNGTVASTWEEQPVDIDLRGALGDDLTPPGNLLIAASNAVGGSVALLPDGRTARFTPATNFSSTAALEVVATDMGFDPRLLLYYHFEAPGDPGGGLVTDNSDNLRDATVRIIGAGSASLDTNVPAALGVANLRSLRLLESNSTNVASLTRLVPTNEFNFNDHDWTFAGWFKRATQTTEDFIFYIGDGDGFGANEELQLHGVANSPTLNLRHYIGETNMDVKLVVSGIATGEWHHAAITFTRTNAFAGILALYVDGTLAGAGMVPHFNLPQTVPVVFGGHNRTNSKPERWFSGWLDDLAMFTVALSSNEIATLATRTVGHHTGLTSTNFFAITVRNINDPPVAGAGATNTVRNASVDLDLWALASDLETPRSNLLFSVSSPVNGSVLLLSDGHTARFTPAPSFTGAASFTYSATDLGEDPRALVHYSFAPPEPLAASRVADNTGHGHDGTLINLGTGSFALSSAVPALITNDVTASLTLNDQGTNGSARLQCPLVTNEFDLSGNSWTVAAWVNRFATTNDDFLFYTGSGDGFGGSGDELQLYCPSGANTVRVRHYNTGNSLDADFVTGGAINAGSWHHVVLSFERAGWSAGTLRLYTNGTLAGASNLTWVLQQTKPLVLGGHNASSKPERSWNGRFTDLVLFTNALSGLEIARLATRSVTRFGGLSATNTVAINVLPANTAPTLAAVSNRTISAGVTLIITNAATDPEVPPQVLTFDLLSAPPDASLNASNGVFTWRPSVAQGNSSNWVTVRVSDNGAPLLSATQGFRVMVLPVSKPVLGSLVWDNTQFGLSVSGDAGPDYTIQASADLNDAGNWLTLFRTNSPMLPFDWADTNTSYFTQRFYRVLLGP